MRIGKYFLRSVLNGAIDLTHSNTTSVYFYNFIVTSIKPDAYGPNAYGSA